MVVIGNEILSGKVTDTNSPYLARHLRGLGVELARVNVIPDEIDTIAAVVAEYAEAFDVVFTSGGVGPTHDDVTLDGVARAFGVELVEDPGLRASMERIVGDRPDPAFLKMAQVPQGAELVEGGNPAFPTVVKENVYVLPGIPEIFQSKVEGLSERFRSEPYHLRTVLVSQHETSIAKYLDATLAEYPDLLLGSYPKLSNPEYKVRLTLESKDEKYVDRALDDLVSRMPEGFVVRVER